MALPSINFPLISPPESPLAALLKNALSSYDTVQNLKVNNIKNKYIEPELKAALAQHAAELEGLKIKNQYLPQSLQAELALNQAKLTGENINNQYLPQLLGAKIEKLKNIAQGQQNVPLSNVAKLQRDYQNAVDQYGENSPQAIELKSAIDRNILPVNVQNRQAAERAMQPYIREIKELLPDVQKYFGARGSLRLELDRAKGSPDAIKFNRFHSALENFRNEAALLQNIQGNIPAREDFKTAFNYDKWFAKPKLVTEALLRTIDLVQEAGKASTVPGYKGKNNNQKMITGSDGKKYSIEELQKIAGGSQ